MFGKASAIVCSFFLATSTPALAETWICTYAEDGAPHLSRFEIRNNQIIQGNGTAIYSIIQNTNDLLVGTGVLYIPSNLLKGAVTILVDKKTGEYRQIGTVLSANDFPPRHGTCVQN